MLLLPLILGLVLVPQDAALANEPTATPIHFTITPKTSDGRAALHITMTLTGSAEGITTLHLPDDYYGTPRLHEFVRDIEVSGGSLLPIVQPALRRVSHHPRATIHFRYTIAFDPSQREGSAYRPSVGPSHFHFLGPQWMARIDGENDLSRDFTLTFRDLPEGWTAFSSFGVGEGPHGVTAPWSDLVTTVLGGGEYASDTFEASGASVHTFIREPFEVGTAALFEAIRKIVRHQREFFGGEHRELLVVTLTPRDGLLAGTSIRNAMICYASPGSMRTRLANLLAHEMFHQWLPNRGQVDPGSFEESFDWMNEGFTEYFGRRLLLEQGLMDGDEYRGFFNRDLRELGRNPHRGMKEEELERVHREGSFTNVHYRLSYLRGALIALDWDTRICARGDRSLGDALREIVEQATESGGELPEASFHALMATYGVDSQADIARWIERGEPIVPDASAFGPDFERREVSIAESGFRRETSERRGSIVGLDEDGPAWAAGLRSGMELISIEDEGERLTVTVRIDGEAVSFRYAPKSRSDAWQYLPKK